MLKNIRPIGITPNRVTVIPVESKELKAGQVKFEPAKKPRPRYWAVTWRDSHMPHVSKC